MASDNPGGAPGRFGPVSLEHWPAIGWEERRWVPRIPAELVSRRVRERHDGSIEIAQFDAEMGTDIAPFASILLRSESAASSRIERLTASAKAIGLAELGDRDRQNASEIVANTHAMQAAVDLASRLDAEAILAMHQALMHPDHEDFAGRWRTEQVWIGGSDYGPHSADFVPPHHDHVPALMADLTRFIQRDDIPTLVQAAIAHAQFETIHPFPDGNGRTGRA